MIAVIGGGLSGLAAAIRLAEQGVQVDLFEAAPELGGRTRSFYEASVDELCDNGPHLLVGAYRHTRRLLDESGASDNVYWQPSLELPLWDDRRGLFRFYPSPQLPFPLAMAMAAAGLPGHALGSAMALLRLGRSTQSSQSPSQATARDWLTGLDIPAALIRDLLEPLCLGAMNEASSTAAAASFKQVLRESFASRDNARLGWFNAPISQALIDPLAERALQLGVRIHRRRRIRSLTATQRSVSLEGCEYRAAILALPAYAAARLLGRDEQVETRTITNVHLWFDSDLRLPAALVGGIGTQGHWFFDISAQMRQQSRHRHICVVISADSDRGAHAPLIQTLVNELTVICKYDSPISPIHIRTVREKRATVLVRPHHPRPALPPSLIDAGERPQPGELPATIESAIRRGEAAAKACLASHFQPHRP